jgi:hypothetical protein
MKTALITGVTGQDGSYLAELLSACVALCAQGEGPYPVDINPDAPASCQEQTGSRLVKVIVCVFGRPLTGIL